MPTSKSNLFWVAALCVGAVSSIAQDPTPLVTRRADQLIAVLQSGAGRKEKADACRELAVVGGKEAVPVLAALLPDEELNHMARYALETIPDPSVDVALRDALGKLSGRPLVGVIGSLGVRHDAQAVKPLSRLLQNPDPDVAQAAARALGKIGISAAARAIEGALAKTASGNQLAFCEGLFRCAEAMAAKGQRSEALALYERLRRVPNAPQQVRAGALRGLILNDPKKGLTLLRESLRSQDYILAAAAARVAMELPAQDVTRALTSELGQLPADRQILVIQTLGKRRDPSGLETLSSAARSGDAKVRLAAVRALPELGDPTVTPVLVALLWDTDPAIARAAQESLAAVEGREADAAVMQMLTSSKTSERLTAIELIGRRRMKTAVPELLKAAADPDAQVRPAAVKRLGELSTTSELPALLDLLTRASTAQDRDAAEQALTAVCTRAENAAACAGQVAARLAQAQPAQKGALLRVLGALGGKEALQAVRAAASDSDAEVRTAALGALGNWKTADAAPALLALAQTAANPSDRMICLRGYLRWAADADLPVDRRLTMCQQATGLIQQDDEKRLLLGALGTIKTADSIALIAPHLDSASTREEASAATVAVAEELLKGPEASALAPKLIEPLQKAAQIEGNADLARRAKALLQQAQSKAGGKRE